jgi:metallo-beta-lactamase family protein
VVLAGYQAEGTRGRLLLEGAQHLKMHGKQIQVRAEIMADEEFSVHADRSELLDWLAALDPKPEQVFAVHGTPESAAALAQAARAELGLDVRVAELGQSVDLG